jgi:hypothetical protein
VTAAGVLLLAVLPGRYVWSPKNRFGSFMVPRAGQNLEKMPPDLLVIARDLDRDEDVGAGTILCGEEAASFLTSWSARFRFVMTRPFYAVPTSGAADDYQKWYERDFLMLVAQHGVYAPDARLRQSLTGPRPSALRDVVRRSLASASMPQLEDLPRLFDRYRVRYVITPPPAWLQGPDNPAEQDSLAQFLAERAALLRRHGFREVYAGGEYSLWKRLAP